MSSVVTYALDSFRNLVAQLNTTRDKQYAGQYFLRELTDNDLLNIYRGSWMGRKVVNIPAQDATRRWREWKADVDQIEAIEAEEKRLKLQQKTRQALQLARLLGGAAIYYSIEGDDPALPLDPEGIGLGGLSFATVLPRDILIAGELEDDPLADEYGKPKYYEVSSRTGNQRIHPSRLAIFIGAEIPAQHLMVGRYQGWGDSVLQAAYDAVQNADSVATNMAALVYEAKVDVLQIPNLPAIMRNQHDRELLVTRIELAAQLKGNNGMLVLDKEETYEHKSLTFAGLQDVNVQAMQAASGSADIPMTRFLGQSPAGMNSTGESDIRNYYDMVADLQATQITPALYNLDECLIRSALGDRPEEIYYEWASLWQMTDKQKTNKSVAVAGFLKGLVETGLFPEEDLAVAAASLLVEHTIIPEFELDLAALRRGVEEEQPMEEENAMPAQQPDNVEEEV